jgi:hypothetical protein
MVLVEIVHVPDDLDADNLLDGPEGKREKIEASASERAVTG